MTIRLNDITGSGFGTGSLLSKDLNDTFDETTSLFSMVLDSAINYALDGMGTTNQSKFDFDLFVADTATTSTNLTYDSSNDWYICDTGQDTCTLITDEFDLSSGSKIGIIRANTTSEDTTNITTYISFDSGGNYTEVIEGQLTNITDVGVKARFKWVFDRSGGNTGSDYIEGYGVYVV